MTPDEIEEARIDIAVLAQIMHDRSAQHEGAGRESEAEAFAGYEALCWRAANAILHLREQVKTS